MTETLITELVEEECDPSPPRRSYLYVAVGFIGVLAAAVALGLAISQILDAPSSGSEEILVVDDAGTVQLLDPVTGEVLYSLPDAVVAPDRSTLFTASSRVGGSTDVESRDPETGLVTGVTSVQGEVEIRLVSPKAGAIALMEERPDGLGLYEPVPRDWTTITVAYTDERPSQVFGLEGNYEPETFSLDEKTLYLLEFEPPDDPEYYFVRELDLTSGIVEGVKSPQVDLRPEMRGVARAQAASPDGVRLYTAYTIPGDEDPVHDPGDVADPDRWAFVHVLDLEQGYDFCLFLPAPMGTVNEATIGVGLSPDGSTLWVADPSTSLMARIDTVALEVKDVVTVPEIADPDERALVAVADDGTVYVGLGHRISEFDADTLERAVVWESRDPSGWSEPIDELTISANSKTLLYTAAGTVVLIDRETKREAATLTSPVGDDLRVLGPPTGRAVEIPLSCAC